MKICTFYVQKCDVISQSNFWEKNIYFFKIFLGKRDHYERKVDYFDIYKRYVVYIKDHSNEF